MPIKVGDLVKHKGFNTLFKVTNYYNRNVEVYLKDIYSNGIKILEVWGDIHQITILQPQQRKIKW